MLGKCWLLGAAVTASVTRTNSVLAVCPLPGSPSIGDTVAPAADGAFGGPGAAGVSGVGSPVTHHQLDQEGPLQADGRQGLFRVSQQNTYDINRTTGGGVTMASPVFLTQAEKRQPPHPLGPELRRGRVRVRGLEPAGPQPQHSHAESRW